MYLIDTAKVALLGTSPSSSTWRIGQVPDDARQNQDNLQLIEPNGEINHRLSISSAVFTAIKEQRAKGSCLKMTILCLGKAPEGDDRTVIGQKKDRDGHSFVTNSLPDFQKIKMVKTG